MERTDTERSLQTLDRLGGRLCLDFVNTVHTRYTGEDHEYLTGYADLVAWGRLVEVLEPEEADRLLAAAARHPAEATAVYERAIALREGLYRIFAAVADGRAPEAADLALLNEALPGMLARLQVALDGKACCWAWDADPEALDRMLWPVIRSAADLLVSDERFRVRECPAPYGCGWLFLDASKNRSRRWCSMETCGNKAKARRHYRRTRATAGER